MKLTEENYVEIAENAIKEIRDQKSKMGKRVPPVTTSKIRNLLAMTAAIYNDVVVCQSEKLSEEIVGRINYLKIRFVYEAGREDVYKRQLFKCAMFGEDANWGRILCAIGYADAEFDIDKVDVSISSKAGCVNVCKNGSGIEFSEDEAAKILHEDELYINIDLNQGDAQAKAWGCDLTYDYVKINGDYRS